MVDKTRGRKGSRERILDAAGELVTEVGAGRLTLEAVAERAGLSKGGLLYNFPSKDALLQGMVERMVQEISAKKEALRSEIGCKRNLESRLSVAASLLLCCGRAKDITTGLLAASSESPHLLEPARQVLNEEWQNLKSTSEDPAAAMVAWLAIQGLNSLEMHDVSPVTPPDREEVVKAVYRLLDKGLAE
jgi:AcrR family transcriptional regulator